MNDADVAKELAALRAEVLPKLERLERFIIESTTKPVKRAQQARKLGVHPSTLWRREQRAAAKLLANPWPEYPSRKPAA